MIKQAPSNILLSTLINKSNYLIREELEILMERILIKFR